MLDPMAVIESRLKTTSQRALAAELRISASFMGDIVQRRRPPSERVIEALGLERVITYRRRKDHNGNATARATA